jgi:hypothetical protein
MKGAKTFRHVGIEPSLCSKYDIIFINIVAMGEYVGLLHKDSYQMKIMWLLE